MRVKMPMHGIVPIALLLEGGLTFADLKVYTALASFQGSNDDSYPSRAKIVERCGLVVETVSRSVVHLVELGWVERVRRPNATSIYRVMIELPEVTATSLPGNDLQVTPEVTATSLPSIIQKEHLKDATKTKKEPKHKHGEYSHVLLTSSELDKIKKAFPLDWEQRVKNLDEGIELKGYKYKSHYMAILKWAEKERSNVTPFKPKQDGDDSWRFHDPLSGKLL